jgi:phenylpropionate dioxygenase-like ring-hydroxylating dioxygenase large terminal subunit
MPNKEAEILWQQARDAIARISPQRGQPSTSSVTRYTDPARHEAELAALRRLPHVVGPAQRVAQSGDWFSTQLLGVPILITNGADGVVRAFINVCRHRGAVLAPGSQCGSGKTRFICPYHSWTYDTCGDLVGRPHEQDFPHVPREAASLVPLPVALRCGMVWVVPQAINGFDWIDYFGPMAGELEELGYDNSSVSPHERSFVQPSNWKLVLDANLESYHFQYAHRETIAHLFHDNLVQHQLFGRHQRIVLPKQSLSKIQLDDISWDLLGRHSNIIYFFFPSTFLLWEGDHINGFCVTPLTPDTCQTDSWMLAPHAVNARRAPEHWDRNFKIFWNAIDEDFALAASIHSGLRSGANTELHFGMNEFACDLFQCAVEELLASGSGK